MSALGARGLIGALVLGLALGAWAAWAWQANRYGEQLAAQAEANQRSREQAAVAVIDWQERQQVERRALEDRLQVNDETHYKELRNAQTEQARLRDRLATADVRLSVLLAAPGGGGGLPADTGGAGVDHGEARAELDPAHAQRIIAIAGDGDQGLIALAACQEYVRGLQASKE
ncbi:bacteriophage Rz lysis protein [Pseudomonas protegens]|uniref:Putative phage protein n=1 Tax=Pseudomonas protegens (strain DSM 19095 / LMG 27888 / CFBP 6595 / CHA0) TaxID=1124983 RepID=A0A2C9EPS4_PSEPH|nr:MULTISPECIES: lysis system i-spanin subunit Rz [Pseudomonas]GED77773.1 lysis protein [Pseudomonas fluorescens]AGL85611.1 putative phage protein [Pseudomonas protegens CHA0]MBP5100668.1 lysis protein [Pseudomonas protegens]MBP5112572.1 lysis protein [Pseudomonas protegens]MBP5117011.1 lysis protein [Pseudomonas protegens]